MNSFYEYFAAQQKMAAFRQAKRMQRGVKLGYDQIVNNSDTAKFISGTLPIGTGDFSIEFFGNTFGSSGTNKSTIRSNNIPTYDKGSIFVYSSTLGKNAVSWVLFEKPNIDSLTGDSVLVNWEAESEEKFLLTITRQGTTVKVYINGELKVTKEQSEVKDLGDLQLAICNSSDVGFVRVWNYALSADEIATLYNNGDPMGYVVPRAKRTSLLAEYLPQNLMKINKPSSPDISFPTSGYTESNSTFAANNPGSVSNTTFDNPAENGFSGPFIKDTAITKVSMYCAYHNRSEYLNIPIRLKVEYRCNADIYDSAALSNILLQANESDAKEAYINYGPGNGFLVSAPNPDAWLEIRVLSIEFWDGVFSSWLDSAKQLPLSDEYMEPLFQSIGGYDMTGNGAPEILYNE